MKVKCCLNVFVYERINVSGISWCFFKNSESICLNVKIAFIINHTVHFSRIIYVKSLKTKIKNNSLIKCVYAFLYHPQTVVFIRSFFATSNPLLLFKSLAKFYETFMNYSAHDAILHLLFLIFIRTSLEFPRNSIDSMGAGHLVIWHCSHHF